MFTWDVEGHLLSLQPYLMAIFTSAGMQAPLPACLALCSQHALLDLHKDAGYLPGMFYYFVAWVVSWPADH